MAETRFQLEFNREQRAQLFAHVMVYLLHLTKVRTPTSESAMESVRGIVDQLFLVSGDASAQFSLTLTIQERDALQQMFFTLPPLYEQWSDAAMRRNALEHLSICRLLLQQAEQQNAQEQLTARSEIILFCQPQSTQGIADAFTDEINDADGALPIQVHSVIQSGKRYLGVIVLEWQGPITADFLRNLRIDEEILDYAIYTWTNGGHGDKQEDNASND